MLQVLHPDADITLDAGYTVWSAHLGSAHREEQGSVRRGALQSAVHAGEHCSPRCMVLEKKRKTTQTVKHPLHQLRNERHISPKYRMSALTKWFCGSGQQCLSWGVSKEGEQTED